MKFYLLVFLLNILFCISSNNRYLLIDRKCYSLLEYEIIKQNIELPFVLNQPYKINEIENIIDNKTEFKNKYFDYEKSKTSIVYSINPSIMLKNKNFHKSLNIDGQININSILFVNNIRFDETLKNQADFHGDTTNPWIVGYFDESYVLFPFSNSEIFIGRMPRNLGIINEYSLLLSNYPFSYDHIGFTTSNEKLKYSFYTSRLNDVLGYDIQDSIQYYSNNIWQSKLAKRYFAIQRLDVKINNNFQISFSETSLYGGPNQNFIFSYINPVYFFYAGQRNQSNISDVQMNGFWQINLFYKNNKGYGLYLDLFADDIIVNNVKNQNDIKEHPNRLAYQFKISCIDKMKLKNLISLIYCRVFNETYLSFRTWENYSYFNRSLGYPYNSYESIKFEYLDLNFSNKNFGLFIELYQRGNQDFIQPFTNEINEFPLPEVKYGLNGNFEFNVFHYKNFDIYFDMGYNFENTLKNKIFSGNINRNINFEVKYFYK